jgi:hypothetical protein
MVCGLRLTIHVGSVFSMIIALTYAVCVCPLAVGWSNGGYSANPASPDYGTHDWIADHALDWLPVAEKQWILDHNAAYLFGTETPDRRGCGDCIGDTNTHHVYYRGDGSLQDDAAANRARQVYDQALAAVASGNWTRVAVLIGAMTHYIDDLAVFGHVMGSATDWGSEVHHSDYEDYVSACTSTYSSEFTAFLAFDGDLYPHDPYDAALLLAFDTTFGGAIGRNAAWMDHHYDWSNSEFRSRAGESINLAVNYLADVLHGFWLAAGRPIPEFQAPFVGLVVGIIAVFVASHAIRYKRAIQDSVAKEANEGRNARSCSSL